jgi:alkanesulfonate monooxygenase SsuD/methylene tetrahydromethanopterin reductase-like flavin-dependent oxidoreductase (luciferase family)
LAVLAASWATLDELSGGRAVMGIGVGESSVRNIGLKPDRLADLEAKISVLRLLMRGEEATHDGETFHLTWAKREVPIFMARSGPKSLQMGGRVADGVLFQVGSEPSFVQYALDNIRLGAEQAGRGLEDIKLFMRLACDVSEDRDKSREHWMRRSRDSRRSQIWESMVSFVRREWMTRWNLSRSRISDGGVQDCVTSTLNSVRRGAELTKQLLTFSSNQDLNVTHVDLNELVLCMQGMLQRTLGEDISVKTNLCGDVWQVMADEGQVENALLNL